MEKAELSKIWEHYNKHRDIKSKTRLVEYYFTFVNNIAKQIYRKLNQKVSVEELASYGVDGLYKALETYNDSYNTKFETFAYSRIWGSMFDQIRKDDWVPRSVRVRHLQMERARTELEAEQGRKVVDSEILARAGISEPDFHRQKKKWIPTACSSIDASSSSEILDEDNKQDFNECLVSKNASAPDAGMVRREFFNRLMGKDFARSEKEIIYLYYYEGLTMKQIATRLGTSEPRVSQIHQELLRRLRKQAKGNPDRFDRCLATCK